MSTELLEPEVWKAVTNPLPQDHMIIMSLTYIPEPRCTLGPVGGNTTVIHLCNCFSVFCIRLLMSLALRPKTVLALFTFYIQSFLE